MKKNTMATAIVAGLAGVAGIANISTAVNLNPDGVGQALIYPYYTVNGGNTTVLSVVNTTSAGKAVKVRFLDARNSREVLDFNLYLSEYDVWTAAIFSQADNGPANIVTSDTSCTVPGIENPNGLFILPTLADGRRFFPFRNVNFTDFTAASQAPLRSDKRTRDGYVEMIEMGTIQTNSGFGQALTHFNNRPSSCISLEEAWLGSGGPTGNGIWFTQVNAGETPEDTDPPSGGLFGAAAIVDVEDGTYMSYNAEAIDGFRDQQIHLQPGNEQPRLANVQNSATPGNVTSYVFDRGRLITSNWATAGGQGFKAVSALFMRQAIFNEYSVDENLGAESEWIVTFPTRRFHLSGPTAATSPNAAPFVGGYTSCQEVSTRIYNREEDTFRLFNFSPGGDVPVLCWEANPLWFKKGNFSGFEGNATPIFGAPGQDGAVGPLWSGIPTTQRLFGQDQKTFSDGWFWLGFYDQDRVNSGGLPAPLTNHFMVETQPAAGATADIYYGLPAVGFWALRVVNANSTPGVNASYTGAYPHRASRACFKGNFNGSPCD